ncbi:HigA family addiction module antitoxin [Myxococcota bacterium]|nr:HigA family addiction module antitoxin [Myxococcota bacterium]
MEARKVRRDGAIPAPILPTNRLPTSPGRMLARFLEDLEVTQADFAAHLGLPVQRVNEIIRDRRGISPRIAWMLGQALGTTPQFWMNVQTACDLARNRPDKEVPRMLRADAEATGGT